MLTADRMALKRRDDDEEETKGGYKFRFYGNLSLSDVVVLGWTRIRGPTDEDTRFSVPNRELFYFPRGLLAGLRLCFSVLLY